MPCPVHLVLRTEPTAYCMLRRHPAQGTTAPAQLNEALLKSRRSLTKFQQRSPPGGGNSCTKILRQKQAGVANDSMDHDKTPIKGRETGSSLSHSLSLPLPLCLLLRSTFSKITGHSFGILFVWGLQRSCCRGTAVRPITRREMGSPAPLSK